MNIMVVVGLLFVMFLYLLFLVNHKMINRSITAYGVELAAGGIATAVLSCSRHSPKCQRGEEGASVASLPLDIPSVRHNDLREGRSLPLLAVIAVSFPARHARHLTMMFQACILRIFYKGLGMKTQAFHKGSGMIILSYSKVVQARKPEREEPPVISWGFKIGSFYAT